MSDRTRSFSHGWGIPLADGWELLDLRDQMGDAFVCQYCGEGDDEEPIGGFMIEWKGTVGLMHEGCGREAARAKGMGC